MFSAKSTNGEFFEKEFKMSSLIWLGICIVADLGMLPLGIIGQNAYSKPGGR